MDSQAKEGHHNAEMTTATSPHPSDARQALSCKCGTSKPQHPTTGSSALGKGEMQSPHRQLRLHRWRSHLQFLNSRDPKSTGKVRFYPCSSCTRNAYLLVGGTRRRSANEYDCRESAWGVRRNEGHWGKKRMVPSKGY